MTPLSRLICASSIFFCACASDPERNPAEPLGKLPGEQSTTGPATGLEGSRPASPWPAPLRLDPAVSPLRYDLRLRVDPARPDRDPIPPPAFVLSTLFPTQGSFPATATGIGIPSTTYSCSIQATIFPASGGAGTGFGTLMKASSDAGGVGTLSISAQFVPTPASVPTLGPATLARRRGARGAAAIMAGCASPAAATPAAT